MRRLSLFTVFTLSFLALAACATAPDPVSPAAAAPAAPSQPVFLVDDILGADRAALDALLGPPGLKRREGAGEYRRYALSECALIVILYPDDTGASRAAHIDASALVSGDDKPDLEACLAKG